MEFFVAALILSLGLGCVQPQNKPDKGLHESKKNFVNFLDSVIGKHDEKRSEMYRANLQEDIKLDQQRFDTMKDEFHSARLKTRGQSIKRNGLVDVEGAARKREATNSSGEEVLMPMSEYLELKANVAIAKELRDKVELMKSLVGPDFIPPESFEEVPDF